MPCSRYTANPATATTATATTTIQRWLSRRLIENRCNRDPFMSGDRRGRWTFSIGRLINEVDGTTLNWTPQHRTGQVAVLAMWTYSEPALHGQDGTRTTLAHNPSR
jgi:hypothetical protein